MTCFLLAIIQFEYVCYFIFLLFFLFYSPVIYPLHVCLLTVPHPIPHLLCLRGDVPRPAAHCARPHHSLGPQFSERLGTMYFILIKCIYVSRGILMIVGDSVNYWHHIPWSQS